MADSVRLRMDRIFIQFLIHRVLIPHTHGKKRSSVLLSYNAKKSNFLNLGGPSMFAN